ncbi:MAG: hypothetical protein QXN10_05415 [Desulfurococcaceae archaeon]
MSEKKQSKTTTTEKSKEIKIVSKQVVTLSDIEKNPRLIKLLYIISLTNGISEKALIQLLYLMKENGLDLNYRFINIANMISSKDVLNELVMLKYAGLIEVIHRKIAITGLGKEFLSKKLDKLGNDAEVLKKLYSELKPKIAPIDVEIDIKARRKT